jgi:pimeloyl-ACP methyl ester carboxylesterase
MRLQSWMSVVLALVLAGMASAAARSSGQGPVVRTLDEKTQDEYAGVYRWDDGTYLYLQTWAELTATRQLVAFDESGEIRALFAVDRDRFITGPGAGLSAPIESQIRALRNADGIVTSLTWQRGDDPARTGRRMEVEKREDVQFKNGDVRLAGTLISPRTNVKHPAIILVHGSGAQDRGYILPAARFLVRHGAAVFGYDKRGVGGSSGSWETASFDDLAGDVVAAVDYLKSRDDIDARHIGLLGWSQAGWVMPLAAVRVKDLAFLISISGAAIPAAETTLDQARNEMTARGAPPKAVEQVVALMTLQNRYARTGEGWNDYATMRQTMVTRMGSAPENFPGTPDHPYWQFLKRIYFYDPAPTLQQLRTPTLAFFGELDNNIVAGKNKAAWEQALRTGAHRDYTLQVLPKANHLLLDARIGSNAEMPALQRIVPAYFTVLHDWLAKRVPGIRAR